MTSPFKSDPKASADCNNCGEEFTYHPTYGTGRICSDCKELLDDPSACEFNMDIEFDTATRTATVTVTVSHDQPVTVHIPPYEVNDNGDGSYTGHIATLHVEDDDGNTVADRMWEHTAHQALRPQRECRLNINHDKIVGCNGERSWASEIDVSNLEEMDSLRAEVKFPAISGVSGSKLAEEVNTPTYSISLD